MTNNDNMLMITMGLTCDGLNRFTITGRDWIKLEGWMRHYNLDDSDETCDISYYHIARNITPKQREKFVCCFSLEAGKDYILHLVYGEESGLWLKEKENTDKYYHKEKAKEVLEELEIEKWNPRSVGGKLDFNRRAVEDGIEWKEE